MDKKGLGEFQQEFERLRQGWGSLKKNSGSSPGEDERVVDQERARAVESKKLSPAKENLEESMGGTWLNRLGIVALFVGLGLAFTEFDYANRYSLNQED